MHTGVGDVALAGDEELLLKILLVLLVDVAQDRVPAGAEMSPQCHPPGLTTSWSLGGLSTFSGTHRNLCLSSLEV